MTYPYQASDNRCRGRTSQTGEKVFICGIDHGIKSGQTQSSARQIDKGTRPTKLTQSRKRPTKHYQRWRCPKRYQVAKTILLLTKLTLVIGKPADTSAQPSKIIDTKMAIEAD